MIMFYNTFHQCLINFFKCSIDTLDPTPSPANDSRHKVLTCLAHCRGVLSASIDGNTVLDIYAALREFAKLYCDPLHSAFS